MKDIIKIYGPPGIGDQLFYLQKIYSYEEAKHINFELYSYERDNLSSPFLAGLKRVKNVSQFKKPFSSYTEFKKKCTEMYKVYSKMLPEELFNQDELFFEANTFLEGGNRIETFLPNFETIYKMPWKTDKTHINEIDRLCYDSNVVVLYTSSIKHNNLSKAMMKEWTFDKWLELTNILLKTYTGIKIVWIGSSFDKSSHTKFLDTFKDELIYYYLDAPSTKIVPLLRQCKCFISYQSGISCTSVIESVPTYMLYFEHLNKLRYSFCPPSSVNNDYIYKPDFFASVQIDDIVKWVGQHLEY